MTRLTMEAVVTAVHRLPGLTVADLVGDHTPAFAAAMLQGCTWRGLIDGRVELDCEWHFYPVVGTEEATR